MTNLQSLDLSNNHISDLKVLEDLANLQSLHRYETCTSFDRLDFGLDGLTNLQSLNLSNNQISELKGLEALPNLQSLDLSNNQISELKGLEVLSNLLSFNISNNQISELKGLDSLTNLKYFFISNNQISEIKGLKTLTNLIYFYISNNQISEVKGMESLIRLRKFDIALNNIIKKTLITTTSKTQSPWKQIDFYDMNSEFAFGKFKGKTVREVLEIEPSYIEWCISNLEYFCITEYEMDKIKAFIPYFNLSEICNQVLEKKHKTALDDYESLQSLKRMEDIEYEEAKNRDRDAFNALTDGQYGSYEDW